MRIKNGVFKVLTVMLLAASFVMTGAPTGGRFEGTAIAKSREQDKKLSSDLVEAISNDPDQRVRVIIDTAPAPNSGAYAHLMARIGDLGGVITRRLNDGKTAAVAIPVISRVTIRVALRPIRSP